MGKFFVVMVVLSCMILNVFSTQVPILVTECSALDTPFATYELASDIVVNSSVGEGFICFDIKSNGITFNGNGYGISAVEYVPAIGVKYSGSNVTVQNLHITNLKTGILAKGQYGTVTYNTIIATVNGIDVNAPHNEISYNTIRGYDGADASSGIYVYFPSIAPTAAHVSITNNVISDIQGAEFALGISVYYATAVRIAYNRIFNLQGAFSKEISVIGGEAEIKGNVFSALPIEAPSIPSAVLLSCCAVLVSALWFWAMQKEKERVKVEKEREEKRVKEEKERVEKKIKETRMRIEKERADRAEKDRKEKEEMARIEKEKAEARREEDRKKEQEEREKDKERRRLVVEAILARLEKEKEEEKARIEEAARKQAAEEREKMAKEEEEARAREEQEKEQERARIEKEKQEERKRIEKEKEAERIRTEKAKEQERIRIEKEKEEERKRIEIEKEAERIRMEQEKAEERRRMEEEEEEMEMDGADMRPLSRSRTEIES